MISFIELGNIGRLGNQLFQYAFLRTQAKKINTDFYCPYWIGDDIFELNDAKYRSIKAENIKYFYNEIFPTKNYDRENILIQDFTDIQGYFESEKNFDVDKCRKWYRFKKEKIVKVILKYKHIDFSNSVGIHLRFGDKTNKRNSYYTRPRLFYYKNALKKVKHKDNLIIFSDEPEKAKNYLKNIKCDKIFIEGNEPYEDLFLMSQCHDFICNGSTFSWWGSWLIDYQDKTVIFPKEGPFRPWGKFKNKDYFPNKCIKINSLIPIFDYNYIYIPTLHFYISSFFTDRINPKIIFMYKKIKNFKK